MRAPGDSSSDQPSSRVESRRSPVNFALASDRMNLGVLQAQWKLGRIRSEDIHIAAARLLEGGVDSPALVRLAGMIGATSWEIGRVIEEAFAEGGLPPVDERAARWRLAYETARQLVAGDLSPREGAATMWQLATELELPKPLRYFVYLAADYGEGPGDRATEEAWFDARILETAQELLALRPSLGESPPPDVD